MKVSRASSWCRRRGVGGGSGDQKERNGTSGRLQTGNEADRSDTPTAGSHQTASQQSDDGKGYEEVMVGAGGYGVGGEEVMEVTAPGARS